MSDVSISVALFVIGEKKSNLSTRAVPFYPRRTVLSPNATSFYPRRTVLSPNAAPFYPKVKWYS